PGIRPPGISARAPGHRRHHDLQAEEDRPREGRVRPRPYLRSDLFQRPAASGVRAARCGDGRRYRGRTDTPLSSDRDSGESEMVGPQDVLAFGREAGPDKWFEKDPAFDAAIAERFSRLWQDAAGSKLAQWEATPEGALALTIVLDQFSRNMFRGDARTYDADA